MELSKDDIRATIKAYLGLTRELKELSERVAKLADIISDMQPVINRIVTQLENDLDAEAN